MIALAIRSSGHHFGAFCSTTEDNILVDVAHLDTIEFNEQDGTCVVGAGCRLGDVSEALAEHGASVPHGECTWVAVGGHVQTGGYSPSFSRSFGYFCDHVKWFDIVLAPTKPGEVPPTQRIVKPGSTGASAQNDDIWWAVLGRSPGLKLTAMVLSAAQYFTGKSVSS